MLHRKLFHLPHLAAFAEYETMNSNEMILGIYIRIHVKQRRQPVAVTSFK